MKLENKSQFKAENPFQTSFRFRPYSDGQGGPRPPRPAPERIYGPIYSIGPLTVCSYLVQTLDGLVVVDTGNASDGDLLLSNIRTLGFDPVDIRLILNTHWHWDHSGGNARLAALSGARLMIHAKDAEVVEKGQYRGVSYLTEIPPTPVARRLEDGDIVEQGGVRFQALHSPGQSAGEVVYLATVEGPQGPCKALFAGDATGFKANVEMLDALGYPGVCADYRKTSDRLKSLHFDLYLGGHPHQVFSEMRADGNPFISRDEWLKALDYRRGLMETFVAAHPKYLTWQAD